MFSTIDEHVYHGGYDRRCLHFRLLWMSLVMLCLQQLPVSRPLKNDENVHKAKQTHHQQHLGYNHKNEFNGSSKVQSVNSLEKSSEQHLSNTKNDRKFHFKTIHKHYFLLCSEPRWIKSKRVNTIFALMGPNLMRIVDLFKV